MIRDSDNSAVPPSIRIVRSSRRQKTVAARLADGGAVLEILAPAEMSEADLEPFIEKLRGRLLSRQRRKLTVDDEALVRRAAELNQKYFGGKLRWKDIRFVSNQQHRYGSCTPASATIRISDRVATMPTWVRDYVIVHELAHLLQPNHSAKFWNLVNRYPRAERARGFLMALGLEEDESAPQDLE